MHVDVFNGGDGKAKQPGYFFHTRPEEEMNKDYGNRDT
jgi:hypothetical protein